MHDINGTDLQSGDAASSVAASIIELAPFAVGDQVKLKSGGPDMTVSGSTADAVQVVWFSVNVGVPCALRDSFPAATLQLVKGAS
jgi:uncharacterized protein YodC (DUF2158 family)